MQWYVYLVGPLFGAFIGWLTNWIAVKMLFHPRREINILGVKIQGLIPKRRVDMTQRVAEIVQEEIVTSQDLRQVIESADLATPLLAHVETKIGQFISEQFGALPAIVRVMIRPEMIDNARRAILDQVRASIPVLTEQLIDSVHKKVDFKTIISEKMNAIEIEKFEELVNRLARQELRSIEIAGAVLGFLIGAVQSIWLLIVG
jgi:uncharacterized membrane protein YheB (UPF0754 family)